MHSVYLKSLEHTRLLKCRHTKECHLQRVLLECYPMNWCRICQTECGQERSPSRPSSSLHRKSCWLSCNLAIFDGHRKMLELLLNLVKNPNLLSLPILFRGHVGLSGKESINYKFNIVDQVGYAYKCKCLMKYCRELPFHGLLIAVVCSQSQLIFFHRRTKKLKYLQKLERGSWWWHAFWDLRIVVTKIFFLFFANSTCF